MDILPLQWVLIQLCCSVFAYDCLSSVLKGSVAVGDQVEPPHAAFHTLVLSSGSKETGVKLTAGEDNTEFVLVSISSPLRGLTGLTRYIILRSPESRLTKPLCNTVRL